MQTYDTVQDSTIQYNAMRFVMWLHVTLHCITLRYSTYIQYITSHHITYIALPYITFPYITYITNHFQVSIKNHQRSPTKKQTRWIPPACFREYPTSVWCVRAVGFNPAFQRCTMFYFTTQQRISRNVTFTGSQLQWFTRKGPQCGVRLVQGFYLVVLVNNVQPKKRNKYTPKNSLISTTSLDPCESFLGSNEQKPFGGSKNTEQSRGCLFQRVFLRANPRNATHTIQHTAFYQCAYYSNNTETYLPRF